ncbi:polysaccharide lyase 6 family protein [Paenibacillus sp. UNC451MF]|uniref:polysaccharide lyase 6 family protein n=1 Tax=Paenibacillus sp. UNC451MF TaxID=1449063 RepID=UPI00068F39F8|nr:polysaccharide lyase 6 family protein [Paenibacillus sp. UNC451MF]
MTTTGNTQHNVSVTHSEELEAALASATAGTTIELEDGSYTKQGPFTMEDVHGTAAHPITIKAKNQGKATITGEAFFQFKQCSYIQVEGLQFTNHGNQAVLLDGSHTMTIIRNTFALKDDGSEVHYLAVKGAGSHHNRIAYNEFGPKSSHGPVIVYDGDGKQISQYDVIEYNYFHDVGPRIPNGLEVIRLGLSFVSMSHGYIKVQHNLFERCDGDPEVMSVKSCSNQIRYNTFRHCQGQVTARHGHNNRFYGNFFLGDGVKEGVGGFRIYGNDHKIFNNYFDGLTFDAINIDGGNFDGGTEGNPPSPTVEQLRKHWKVYRAEAVHNTIVNCTTGIVIGRRDPMAPVDSRVANNLVVNTKGILYNELKPSNTVFEGNIGFGATMSNSSRTESEIQEVDPLLIQYGGLYKLSHLSPAVDSAVIPYPYVEEDMDGQERLVPDVGADEVSQAPSTRKPLTVEDVGPNALN